MSPFYRAEFVAGARENKVSCVFATVFPHRR